jgi:biopolymer transport protein ExbD
MKRCLSLRRKHGTASIEMAPLIDMVFLLLIFYIVSASFVQESSVRISRPESSNAAISNEPYLVVAVTKAGTVHAGGHVVAADDGRAVSRCLSENGAKRVLIQADRAVPTELLLRVMDTCKQAGAETVDVAAIARK